MKIAVIGGGSTYTPELIHGFLERGSELPVHEIFLMDTDAHRLDVVGALGQRMVAARSGQMRIGLTTDRREAIAGSSYVITQLRVGQMRARLEDELLGRRHDLIGQETTGVGGFAKALRTIPVILEVAADVREHAPGALLVNFTNPVGVIAEALARHAGDMLAVGVCNGPMNMHAAIIDGLAVQRGESIARDRGTLRTLGLNHLGWYTGFELDGDDVWAEVLDIWVRRMRSQDDPMWDPDFIASVGVIPNSYLQYFYDSSRKLAEQRVSPTRAEVVMGVEAELLDDYADPARVEPPPGLARRGGAHYSTVATQLINAHHNDLGETHVVDVPHGGAVGPWDPSWVLEMPASVDRAGVHPIPAEPLPPVLHALMLQVKLYELLTVEAAVRGDRDAAYQALITHPLGPSPRHAASVLDDLLETNREYLPLFREAAA